MILKFIILRVQSKSHIVNNSNLVSLYIQLVKLHISTNNIYITQFLISEIYLINQVVIIYLTHKVPTAINPEFRLLALNYASLCVCVCVCRREGLEKDTYYAAEQG